MNEPDAVSNASAKYDEEWAAERGKASASNEAGTSLYHDMKSDKTTGATPGVATACRDLGVSSLDEALSKYKCKPPGQ